MTTVIRQHAYWSLDSMYESGTLVQINLRAMTKDHEKLKITVDHVQLEGELIIPEHAKGLVIFSHGSGSSRFSPRNNFVAQQLSKRGFATFLFDLLTKREDEIYSTRFDIHLLSHRLIEVTKQLQGSPYLKTLPTGYFGASTGAASALMAAANLKGKIKAIVSRGGRPDLAGDYLYQVDVPTLLIVGGFDTEVLKLNQQALEKLPETKSLIIINGATHLFEEPGALEEVALRSANWFERHLAELTVEVVTH